MCASATQPLAPNKVMPVSTAAIVQVIPFNDLAVDIAAAGLLLLLTPPSIKRLPFQTIVFIVVIVIEPDDGTVRAVQLIRSCDVYSLVDTFPPVTPATYKRKDGLQASERTFPKVTEIAVHVIPSGDVANLKFVVLSPPAIH